MQLKSKLVLVYAQLPCMPVCQRLHHAHMFQSQLAKAWQLAVVKELQKWMVSNTTTIYDDIDCTVVSCVLRQIPVSPALQCPVLYFLSQTALVCAAAFAVIEGRREP